MKPFTRIWTLSEEEVLKENYKEYNQRELRDKFFPHRTVRQVLNKKMTLGLKKDPVWSNEERAILLEYGSRHTQRQLADSFLPDKTPCQIHSMRRHLGIRRRR